MFTTRKDLKGLEAAQSTRIWQVLDGETKLILFDKNLLFDDIYDQFDEEGFWLEIKEGLQFATGSRELINGFAVWKEDENIFIKGDVFDQSARDRLAKNGAINILPPPPKPKPLNPMDVPASFKALGSGKPRRPNRRKGRKR